MTVSTSRSTFIVLTLLFTSLLLGACSRSPVVRLYDGPKKPETKLAVVRVPVELEVLSINGRRVENLNTLFSVGYKDLHLEPGRYRIIAYYKDLWEMNADAHDVIKSDPAVFVVDGEAGHFYKLGFDEPQTIEQARELERQFSGYVLDAATGEKTPTRPSGIAFRGGILGGLADMAGTPATTAADAESGGDQGGERDQVIAPAPVPGSDSGKPAPETAAAGKESGTDSGYLDMLKATWSQATPEERRRFLRWVSEQ